ncbi:hypothetical protein EMCG_05526 [[Emmonsia] crescens]|uniref:Uncharacterized protein n=1 Tax=[Emmonsia] crescens TaxID=73230 RepID=A0A0G2HNK9_9EURO|nr:hypothetical protein EMCG_05526 [Emmonsia crescens UAMH 3008]
MTLHTAEVSDGGSGDSSLYALISLIRHSDLPEEWKELIIGVLLRGGKINLEGILRIWRITNPLQGVDQKVLWLEDGSASAGYQHILKHAAEFEELEITKDRLAELADWTFPRLNPLQKVQSFPHHRLSLAAKEVAKNP